MCRSARKGSAASAAQTRLQSDHETTSTQTVYVTIVRKI